MRAIVARGGSEWAVSLRGCLPHLIDLLHEHCDRPVRSMREQVWRVVVEQTDVDEGGDVQHHDPELVRMQVNLLVDQLERIRTMRLESGVWSSVPCPPIMFG